MPAAAEPTSVADASFEELRCARCPFGAECNASGTSVENLVLKPGYFRPTLSSAYARKCPDHTSGSFTSENVLRSVDSRGAPDKLAASLQRLLSAPSGCVGGSGAGDALCSTERRLGGIYCSGCAANYSGHGYFYSATERECLECAQTLPFGVWALGAVAAVAAVGALLRRYAGRWVRHSVNRTLRLFYVLAAHLSNTSVVASLTTTVKTLIGFYQVVSEVEEVFILELPLKAVRFIKSFSFLNLSINELVELECLGYGSFIAQLRINAVVPAILVLVSALVALARERLEGTRRGAKLLRGATRRFLPWALFITFLTFPDVVSNAFQAYRCECFGDESYLRADYSMRCSTGGCLRANGASALSWDDEFDSDATGEMTPEYREVVSAAWYVLVVYAIAVPCLYALLLLAPPVRREIQRGEVGDDDDDAELRAHRGAAKLAQSLSFLHGDYHPSTYWWELVNVFRKLTTVGFATLIFPGTMAQLVLVLGMVLCFTILLAMVRPYKTEAAGLLALVEQATELVFFVLCIIVKVCTSPAASDPLPLVSCSLACTAAATSCC